MLRGESISLTQTGKGMSGRNAYLSNNNKILSYQWQKIKKIKCHQNLVSYRVHHDTYTWAPAGFFPGVGSEGGLKDGSPHQGPGAYPRWASVGEAPEADDIFSKWRINTSSTETTFTAKTLFKISRGGASAPLPMPAGAHAHIFLPTPTYFSFLVCSFSVIMQTDTDRQTHARTDAAKTIPASRSIAGVLVI